MSARRIERAAVDTSSVVGRYVEINNVVLLIWVRRGTIGKGT
jgi:hypothetical protein